MQRQEERLRTGEDIRLDPKLVERWESGEVRPRVFYQARLCLLFETDPHDLDLQPSARLELELGRLGGSMEEPGAAAGQSRGAASSLRLWAVPYQRNPFFTGREAVLDHLHLLLHGEENRVAVTQHALCGLGGIGKTQIAIEYAHRHGGEYDAVLWVRADNAQAMRADLAAIGRLTGAGSSDADVEQAASSARRWLRAHGGWLLVLDNADDPVALRDLLSHAGRGHVLVTTRVQSFGGLVHTVQVPGLSVAAGVLLLLRRSGMLPLTASLQDGRPVDVRLASQLVHEVGGLPLAIDQAAAFLEETSSSLREYLDAFRRHRRELLGRRGGSETDHPAPAATTLSLSLELLATRDPVAADLLRICAYLDPDEIPEEILIKGASEVCPSLQVISTDALRLHQAIASLRRFSLVTRDPERESLAVHRLVQACLQDGMDGETHRLWEDRASRAVRRSLPDPSTTYSSRGRPAHAVQVLRAAINAGTAAPRDADRAAALWRVAVQQQVLGRLTASERSLQECLALCREQGSHIDRLKAHQYLALLRAYQGMPEAADVELACAESLLDGSNRVVLGSAVHGYRALCALLAHNLDAAAAAVVVARDLARQSGNTRDEIRASWLQGRVLTRLAEQDQSSANRVGAARWLDAALRLCHSEKVVDYEADLLLALANLRLMEGDALRADRLGREALAIADRAGFRVLEADIRNLMTMVTLRMGRTREAMSHARRALVCAECDGAPYCYRPALEVAKQHLAAAAQAAG